MTVITMSRNELSRLRVLIDVADGRLSVADATAWPTMNWRRAGAGTPICFAVSCGGVSNSAGSTST